MSRGIRFTRKGYDARKTTDPRLWTLTSQYNTLKIAMQAHGTLSVATGVVKTLNITHNLGYKPILLAYIKHPENGKWYIIPTATYDGIAASPTYNILANIKHVDVNTAQLRVYDGSPAMPSSPTNVEYKYYILIEPRKDAWYV